MHFITKSIKSTFDVFKSIKGEQNFSNERIKSGKCSLRIEQLKRTNGEKKSNLEN
jgi:hypothetical protein